MDPQRLRDIAVEPGIEFARKRSARDRPMDLMMRGTRRRRNGGEYLTKIDPWNLEHTQKRGLREGVKCFAEQPWNRRCEFGIRHQIVDQPLVIGARLSRLRDEFSA